MVRREASLLLVRIPSRNGRIQRLLPSGSLRLDGIGKRTTSTDNRWSVTVNTAGLSDTITYRNPGARNAALDNNQHVVRAVAIGADGTEWPSDLTARFSVDNVDDVPPLGPTNISVTSVNATDSVLETAGDSYTVGGLVDKYDASVPSPVATLTIEPTAARNTYESVRLVNQFVELVVTDTGEVVRDTTDSRIGDLLIGEVAETAEGSGVFTVTVDVGMFANGATYLEKGTYTYMFHALGC